MTKRLTESDVSDIALGATVLGTGGGGDPHVGALIAKEAIRRYGPVELVSSDDLDAGDLVIPSAQMGAPTVSVEKLPNGDEPLNSFERVEDAVGREAAATMPIECGGINSTIPVSVAARRDLPIVDADGMGRAFPELHHETFNIYGVDGTPAAVSDEFGDTCLVETGENDRLEWFARGVTIRMGGVAYVSDYPMSADEVAETAIPGTTTLAREIGAALHGPDDDPIEAIASATAASVYGAPARLFEGKITDVERRNQSGFAIGQVSFDGIDADDGASLEIEFQNENLIARRNGDVIATVPDLITVLDFESGRPIPTESLRYGQRVQVLGIPTPKIMRTDRALDVWGPRTFGLDTDYTPINA